MPILRRDPWKGLWAPGCRLRASRIRAARGPDRDAARDSAAVLVRSLFRLMRRLGLYVVWLVACSDSKKPAPAGPSASERGTVGVTTSKPSTAAVTQLAVGGAHTCA